MDQQILIHRPVGIFAGNMNGFFIAYFHAGYPIIKTFNHLATTQLESQWFATSRRIEQLPIGKGTFVMHLYGIAGLCLFHTVNFFERMILK